MIRASWRSRRGAERKPRCRSSELPSVCRWAPQKASNPCCSIGHRPLGSPPTKVRQQKRHANNSSSNLRFDPFRGLFLRLGLTAAWRISKIQRKAEQNEYEYRTDSPSTASFNERRRGKKPFPIRRLFLGCDSQDAVDLRSILGVGTWVDHIDRISPDQNT